MSSLPPDDPQRASYPAPETLQLIISDARSQLYQLQSELRVSQSRLKVNNRISGSEQLDAMGDQLIWALQNSQECFNKSPQFAMRLTSAMVGIAGFFLKAPLGVGSSLAGRLFQQLFSISSSKDRLAEAERSENAAEMVSGLSCAMENLGEQHCRIIREANLFKNDGFRG